MHDEDTKSVLPHFFENPQEFTVLPWGSGHIHRSFAISDQEGKKRFLLQRINHSVFPDIPALMENLQKVASWLSIKKEESPFLQVPHILPMVDGSSYLTLHSGESFWRVFNFIEGRNYESGDIQEPGIIREAGYGFGVFLNVLRELPPKTLHETIPRFHDMAFRVGNFEKALEQASDPRKKVAEDSILFAQKQAGFFLEYHQTLTQNCPQRVTHNDTKLSNILFGEDGKARAVIDWDTVMGGYVAFDVGDALRSITNQAAEDSPKDAAFLLENFTAFMQGYRDATAHFLTANEVESLHWAHQYMTFMMGLRFLSDFLAGDTYYSIQYSEQNLRRAQAQFTLLQQMQAQQAKTDTRLAKIFS